MAPRPRPRPRPRPCPKLFPLLVWFPCVFASCRAWTWERRVCIRDSIVALAWLADVSLVVCCVVVAVHSSLSICRCAIIWSTVALALWKPSLSIVLPVSLSSRWASPKLRLKLSHVLYAQLVRFHAWMLSLKIRCLWRITRARFIVWLWVNFPSAALVYSTRFFDTVEDDVDWLGWIVGHWFDDGCPVVKLLWGNAPVIVVQEIENGWDECCDLDGDVIAKGGKVFGFYSFNDFLDGGLFEQ